MDLNKKRLLVNAFYIPHFTYFSYRLKVYMCHNRSLDNNINHPHEKCIHLIHDDKKWYFEDLLEKK